jgi:lipopolysaccharide assembly outer membrane protein LptD (OstA)
LYDSRRTGGWTVGQRWRVSNQVNLFNESQYLKAPGQAGLAHTFGMDFFPGVGWNLGFTLQSADLDRSLGTVDRNAVGVSAGRTSSDTGWQSKAEWRDDSGAEQRTQWVTTNLITHKVNESWRLAARVNYSQTDDDLLADAGAEFAEANVGFAWRPAASTRWAVLGKYTYLYDVSSLAQVGDNVAFYDQRSHVLAFDGIFKPSQRWEYAAKVALRNGSVRFGRLAGEWTDSSATFAAAQLRYGFANRWHALGEFRALDVQNGGLRQGLLAGIDRDLGGHFRLGVGYNFTDFSDDLTQFDYDYRGWFLNVVGWY